MFMDLKTQLETVAKNHQASIQDLETKFDRLADKQSGRPSRSFPSNTRNEHANVVFTRSGKSYNPPVNPNDQQNDSETPINFDSDDEDEEPKPQPMTQNPKPVKETLKTFSCNALADLGASINLMPYSFYVKLSLGTLKPTKISIRLANRSFQYPVGIAENMFVEVGKFTFPADFVILKMEEDIKVPLIL
ncbi:reverse transcriptase domain-containing protein [Tanacetum coccineum]